MDIDIYEDLDFGLGNTFVELQKQNETLTEETKKLEATVLVLNDEITQIKDVNEALKINISELYKTALCEVQRKNRALAETRKELDELIVKRNSGRDNRELKTLQEDYKRKCSLIVEKDMEISSLKARLEAETKKIEELKKHSGSYKRGHGEEDAEERNYKRSRRDDRGSKDYHIDRYTSDYRFHNPDFRYRKYNRRHYDNDRCDRYADSSSSRSSRYENNHDFGQKKQEESSEITPKRTEIKSEGKFDNKRLYSTDTNTSNNQKLSRLTDEGRFDHKMTQDRLNELNKPNYDIGTNRNETLIQKFTLPPPPDLKIDQNEEFNMPLELQKKLNPNISFEIREEILELAKMNQDEKHIADNKLSRQMSDVSSKEKEERRKFSESKCHNTSREEEKIDDLIANFSNPVKKAIADKIVPSMKNFKIPKKRGKSVEQGEVDRLWGDTYLEDIKIVERSAMKKTRKQENSVGQVEGNFDFQDESKCDSKSGQEVMAHGSKCDGRSGQEVTGHGVECDVRSGQEVTEYTSKCDVKSGQEVTEHGSKCDVKIGQEVTGQRSKRDVKNGQEVTGHSSKCDVKTGQKVTRHGSKCDVRCAQEVTGQGSKYDVKTGEEVTGQSSKWCLKSLDQVECDKREKRNTIFNWIKQSKTKEFMEENEVDKSREEMITLNYSEELEEGEIVDSPVREIQVTLKANKHLYSEIESNDLKIVLSDDKKNPNFDVPTITEHVREDINKNKEIASSCPVKCNEDNKEIHLARMNNSNENDADFYGKVEIILKSNNERQVFESKSNKTDSEKVKKQPKLKIIRVNTNEQSDEHDNYRVLNVSANEDQVDCATSDEMEEACLNDGEVVEDEQTNGLSSDQHKTSKHKFNILKVEKIDEYNKIDVSKLLGQTKCPSDAILSAKEKKLSDMVQYDGEMMVRKWGDIEIIPLNKNEETVVMLEQRNIKVEASDKNVENNSESIVLAPRQVSKNVVVNKRKNKEPIKINRRAQSKSQTQSSPVHEQAVVNKDQIQKRPIHVSEVHKNVLANVPGNNKGKKIESIFANKRATECQDAKNKNALRLDDIEKIMSQIHGQDELEDLSKKVPVAVKEDVPVKVGEPRRRGRPRKDEAARKKMKSEEESQNQNSSPSKKITYERQPYQTRSKTSPQKKLKHIESSTVVSKRSTRKIVSEKYKRVTNKVEVKRHSGEALEKSSRRKPIQEEEGNESEERMAAVTKKSNDLQTVVTRTRSPRKKVVEVESPEKGRKLVESPEKRRRLVESPEKGKKLADSPEKGRKLVGSPETGRKLVDSPEKGRKEHNRIKPIAYSSEDESDDYDLEKIMRSIDKKSAQVEESSGERDEKDLLDGDKRSTQKKLQEVEELVETERPVVDPENANKSGSSCSSNCSSDCESSCSSSSRSCSSSSSSSSSEDEQSATEEESKPKVVPTTSTNIPVSVPTILVPSINTPISATIPPILVAKSPLKLTTRNVVPVPAELPFLVPAKNPFPVLATNSMPVLIEASASNSAGASLAVPNTAPLPLLSINLAPVQMENPPMLRAPVTKPTTTSPKTMIQLATPIKPTSLSSTKSSAAPRPSATSTPLPGVLPETISPTKLSIDRSKRSQPKVEKPKQEPLTTVPPKKTESQTIENALEEERSELGPLKETVTESMTKHPPPATTMTTEDTTTMSKAETMKATATTIPDTLVTGSTEAGSTAVKATEEKPITNDTREMNAGTTTVAETQEERLTSATKSETTETISQPSTSQTITTSSTTATRQTISTNPTTAKPRRKRCIITIT